MLERINHQIFAIFKETISIFDNWIDYYISGVDRNELDQFYLVIQI